MAKSESRNLKATAILFALVLFFCTLLSELLLNDFCITYRSLFYSATVGAVTAFAWYMIMKYSMPASNDKKEN